MACQHTKKGDSVEYVPKTERGRRLWALRQKYIASGGRLYTLVEIQEELAGLKINLPTPSHES